MILFNILCAHARRSSRLGGEPGPVRDSLRNNLARQTHVVLRPLSTLRAQRLRASAAVSTGKTRVQRHRARPGTRLCSQRTGIGGSPGEGPR